MAAKTALYLALLLLGIIMINAGISGYSIVSQTCCNGESCPEEQKCAQFKEKEPGMNNLLTLIGTLMMMVSMILLHLHIVKKTI